MGQDSPQVIGVEMAQINQPLHYATNDFRSAKIYQFRNGVFDINGNAGWRENVDCQRRDPTGRGRNIGEDGAG